MKSSKDQKDEFYKFTKNVRMSNKNSKRNFDHSIESHEPEMTTAGGYTLEDKMMSTIQGKNWNSTFYTVKSGSV